MDTPLQERDLSSEFSFRTSRSSGSGGQNVNKVSTRVELIFFIGSSALLDEKEKELLLKQLKSRIRKNGALHLFCQEGRSQYTNKKRVIARFYKLLEDSLKRRKKRIPTIAGPGVEAERRQDKMKRSKTKELRRKPPDMDQL